MKLSLFTTLVLALALYGAYAEDDDFTDLDLILQQPLNRHERSPDYGAGLGGPLAASSWTPPGAKAKPGAKPAPAPKSAEKPTTQKPTTQKPTTAAKGGSPAPSSAGPTAPTKAPSKDTKSGGGGGGTNGKSGEDIANELYNHPNECKEPSNGGVWAPLPSGQTCGSDGNCPYPQKWCSAKVEEGKSNPALSCQDLSPECQKALGGGGTDTTAQPETTTTQATTTAAATTKPTTKATVKTTQAATTAGTTAGAGGASSQTNAGCNDGHPYCCFWADDKEHPSECDKNAKWMKSVCAKSCGTCGCTSGDCPTKINTAGCQWTKGGQGQGGKTTIFIGGGGQPPVNPNVGGAPGIGGGNGLGNPGAGAGGPGTGNGGAAPGLTRITFG